MKAQTQIKNDGSNCQADALTDLSVTDEQAEQTKAGGQVFREGLSGEGKQVKIDFCK